MKINSINFPYKLIEAIRTENIVIFAGAGVSMGEPANLPDFNTLANSIASGSGETKPEMEDADRFLGRLQLKGVQVHQRAASELISNSYTTLHKNLLRLFPETECVRVVTTNFDTLFKEAAETVFDNLNNIYRSPALPMGNSFSGIVHVHGCLDHIKGMVLTDADFGRAYLTEGWARRFLVDLFQTYTILFVGYSHDDVIMHYLSRALPESTVARRYSLISNDIDPEQWIALGIEPIVFEKPNSVDFSVLNDGIEKLADYLSRTVFDWKRELTVLASGKPPSDEESEHQLIDVMEDVSRVRLFINVARDRAWLEWLDAKGILDDLFSGKDLDEKQDILATWLAENYSLTYPDDLILLIAKHSMRLNAGFWSSLARQIGKKREEQIGRVHFSKWITVLLATLPETPYPFILSQLAERASESGDINSLLRIFTVMGSSRLEVKKGLNWYEEEQADNMNLDVKFPLVSNHHYLKKVYDKYILPIINDVAVRLSKEATKQLELIHDKSVAWGKSDRHWDSLSFRRSAIEPHEQDNLQHSENILIDAVRDSLCSIQQGAPALGQHFFKEYSTANAPVLRRLAIHSLIEREDIGGEDKLDLFLEHMDLHDIPSHHEIFRLAADIYPQLNDVSKEKLLQEIWNFKWPNPESDELEARAASYHYNWFQWLSEADENCALAEKAKNQILERYPHFQPREHPDLTHFSTGVRQIEPQSPWTAEELIAKPASEWLDDLLTFKGDKFYDPGRSGLLNELTAAVKKDLAWGFSLALELQNKNEWDSFLWRGLIQAWEEWPAEDKSCEKVLEWLSRSKLQETYFYEISHTLLILVRDNSKDCALEVLQEANLLAKNLWEYAVKEDFPESHHDWLQFAINNTAGVLAQFWISSLNLWWNAQDPKPEIIPPEYTDSLEGIIHDQSPAGGVALSVLASKFPYFLSIDSTWATEKILPWFDHDKDPLRMQQSWDGFLTWGNLNFRVFDVLFPYFLKSASRLSYELASQRDRFTEFFSVMIVFYVQNPLDKAIPAFFQNSESKDRQSFAFHVNHRFKDLNEKQQLELWQKWLNEYWQNRLQGIPAPLDGREIEQMLEWLPNLTAVFTEAIELAIKMPQIKFEHLSIGYDLTESNLISSHPNEVSKLLTHVMKSGSEKHNYEYIGEIISKLQDKGVDPGIWQELMETATALGLI